MRPGPPALGTWSFTPDPARRGPQAAKWLAALAGWAVVEGLGLLLADALVLTPDSTGGFLTGWGFVVFVVPYLLTLLAWTGLGGWVLHRLLTEVAAEDRVEVTPSTLVVSQHRGPFVRRRSADRTQVRGVAVVGDEVLARIGFGDTWTLTGLGVPCQRAILATALSTWVVPAPPPSAAGPLPPHLPEGWFVETVGHRAGLPVLRARVHPGKARRDAVTTGAVAAVIVSFGGAVLWHADSPGGRVLGGIVLLFVAVSGTVGACADLRRSRAWEVGAGFLRTGRVVRSGSWAGAPDTATGLRIEAEDRSPDEVASYWHVLSAVSGRDTEELFAGRDTSGETQALGSWLAARAGLPLDDRTRTPG